MSQMFDTAHNRLSYGELLQPDVGYCLDFAVGLTYSLDLEALLGVPISLGLLDEMDNSVYDNPFFLLEAIRKSSDKIAIFCNAGGILMPQKIQSVYSLLENSVFEIKLKNRQNFHPKLWFVKYKNDEGKSYIKFLVLSRNLTFDTSIDLCVAMQGEVTKCKYSKNKPLADMLNFVSESAEKGKRQKIAELAEDIMLIKSFDLEHPFENYEFLPLGIPDYSKEKTELFSYKWDIFAVSPFLSDDTVNDLTKCSGKKTLITRKAAANQNTFDRFDEVYITKDILTDNEFNARQDIHAKLYFTTGNAGNFLYIGSANASYNAFHNNVEFLLKLKYKPYQMGYKSFYDDFLPETNCPFVRIDAPCASSTDNADKELEKAFREAVYAIKSAKVISNGTSYDIEVYAREMKTEFIVKIAPLQRKDAFAPLSIVATLKNMLLRELSEFYILAIGDKKIVVKIDTKNIPQNRDDAVYKSIIDSKQKFLSYISFMLSDSYSEGALEQEEYLRLFENGNVDVNNSQIYSAVYEKMLIASRHNPNRLREIANIMKLLDNDIIGDEFIKMYKQFEIALRRRKV